MHFLLTLYVLDKYIFDLEYSVFVKYIVYMTASVLSDIDLLDNISK